MGKFKKTYQIERKFDLPYPPTQNVKKRGFFGAQRITQKNENPTQDHYSTTKRRQSRQKSEPH